MSRENLVSRILEINKFRPIHYTKIVLEKHPDLNRGDIHKLINYRVKGTKEELAIIKKLEKIFL